MNIFNDLLIEKMLKKLKLEDLISAINIIDNFLTEEQFDEYFYKFENILKKAIDNYAFDFSVTEYCENKNIDRLIKKNSDGKINKNEIYSTISGWIDEEVYSDIQYYLILVYF